MSLAMKSFDTDSGLQKRNSQKVFNAQGGTGVGLDVSLLGAAVAQGHS